MLQTPDAVVIGAGPAGSLAARRLARQGWSVLLVERGGRYRDKACGHCLNPRALDVLDREGLLAPLSAGIGGRSVRVRFRHGSGSSISARSIAGSEGPPGWLVPRHVFDQGLSDAACAAGVVLVQPAAATVLKRDAGGASVRVRMAGRPDRVVRTPLVVGADGLGSRVARALGLARGVAGRKFGFSFDLPGGSGGVDAGVIEMYLAPAGYLGVVRQNDGMLHVAGLVGGTRDRSRRDPFAFSRDVAGRYSQSCPEVLAVVTRGDVERFAAAGPMPWRPGRVANDRGALVGDAAGYVEPVTGEGMSWALESAEALTELLAVPGRWSERLARQYERAHRRLVQRRQRLCRIVAGGLERPRLGAALVRAMAAHPAVTQRLVHHVVSS
ncbi:MAG: NAD(P)/FAD-dependent oxidoreductase [Planctomycetota bacterium]|jgi:flavin-dependent dehydrogenase